jgi:hypothetical protein
MCISPIVARQRLDKHLNAGTNKSATMEEMLQASISMQWVFHQRKVGD